MFSVMIILYGHFSKNINWIQCTLSLSKVVSENVLTFFLKIPLLHAVDPVLIIWTKWSESPFSTISMLTISKLTKTLSIRLDDLHYFSADLVLLRAQNRSSEKSIIICERQYLDNRMRPNRCQQVDIGGPRAYLTNVLLHI